MKKIIVSLSLLVASMGLFAQYTAKADIALSSNSTEDKTLKLRQGDSFSDAYDNGFDVENVNAGGIYVISSNSKHWLQWATNKLAGAKIGFATCQDEAYKLKFSNVSGDIKLVDKVMDSTIVVVSGTEYAFVAEKNQTINDRFSVFKPFTPDPGELNVCWRYEEIQILNNPYAGNIVVKDAQGNKVKDVAPKSTPQFISLKDLTPGRYTLEMDNGKDVLTFKK